MLKSDKIPEAEKTQIIKAALEILGGHPEGMKGQELRSKIRAQLPQYEKQIYRTLLDYSRSINAEVYQSSRLSYRLTKFKESDSTQVPPQPLSEKVAESAFYKPFAKWLVEDVQECTKAIAVGGAKLKDKWGTPDVIGIYMPLPGDFIQFPIEIVSVEIKVSQDGLIAAFGQACSYKLFSHKSYIAIPNTASDEDRDRLEALCWIFGIGLVVFNPASPENPAFEIRARATKYEPDMFYANEKVQPIRKELLG